MNRIFFDVTDLRFYLTHAHRLSGIQRVTVMVIQHAAKAMGADAVYLSFLDGKTNTYRCMRYSDLGTDQISSPKALSTALGVVPAGDVRPSLRRYANHPTKRAFHTAVRNLNAAIGNRRHFEKRYTTIEAWKDSAVPTRGAQGTNGRSFPAFFDTATTGDCLLLLDASWGDARAGQAHTKAHKAGIRVFSLIHDLIPITSPEFVVGQQGVKFHNWLRGTLDYVDVYLANSEATAVDLRAFLEVYGGADKPVAVTPLAQAGIPVKIDKTALPDMLSPIDHNAYDKLYSGFFVNENVRALLKRPYVLCVGTIESRKNTWSMTQAWDRMQRAGVPGLPRLVFAGRPGWLNADFDRFMGATGYLGGWIEILHGPSDEELDFLYRNCLFTIFTSYKEGWGLPIGESLSYGKTGVVSNCSSMPEVGGDMVEYCDPMSVNSIEQACRKLIEDPAHRHALEAKIAETRLRSWEDVAADVIEAVRGA